MMMTLKRQLTMLYRQKIAFAFVTPAFLLIGTFIGYPVIESIILSFYKWDGIGLKKFVGARNYQRILVDEDIWVAIYANVQFTALTVIGTVLIGFLLAFAIERRVKGWSLFKVIYFLPVMMSMTVVGMLWGNLLDPVFGVVNVTLKFLGISNPPSWLGDGDLALTTVGIITVWQFAGFPMILLLAEMENISPEIHEAATLDGVNVWQRAIYVTLPMLKQVLAIVILLQIIFSFKVFDIIWAMTQGGPGNSTSVLGVYLYRSAFDFTWFGYASTIAVIMTMLIFTVSSFYKRILRLN